MSVACLVAFLSSAALGVDEVESDYLSDVIDDRVCYQIQGWGTLGVDTAIRPPDGRAPTPLRIGETTYDKGLGAHASGEIVVELNGDYAAFSADVGVQWQNGGSGSVVFQVYVDDQLRFDSGVMREQDAARHIGVSLQNADLLRMVVTDAGDGIMCDCADWANARLVKVYPPRKYGKRAAEPAVAEQADMAPFARVVSWDPHRDDGVRVNRVQEFPAEDVYLESAVPIVDGAYEVARAPDGVGCIGLQWAEPRMVRVLGLEFAAGAPVPTSDRVQLQYWIGESPWQGAWKPLHGTIVAEGNRWTLTISSKETPDFPKSGVDKFRWIFPAGQEPIRISKLSAFTRSRWDVAVFRLELDAPAVGATGVLEVYNGAFVTEAGDTQPAYTWDLSQPVQVRVRYVKPRPWKTDRTLLRIGLPQGACSVAAEDVIQNGCVYVRDLGVYVAPATANGAAEYRKSIEGKKTVLERVREMPDQTFAQALEKTHVPIQNLGPTMLSMACDNRKFVAHRDGAVQFSPYGEEPIAKDAAFKPSHRLVPKFGSGKSETAARRLDGGWLPAPVIVLREGDVEYRERTFVAPAGNALNTAPMWLCDRPICVVEFTMENVGEQAADASIALTLSDDQHGCEPAKTEEGAIFAHAGDLIAFVDSRTATPLKCSAENGAIMVAGSLPPRSAVQWAAYIPAWKAAATWLPESDAAKLFDVFTLYWKRALADAMQVEVPDPLLTDVIRASQVHCLLAARNELDGKAVAAWIASDRYGPLESEAHSLILGMDLMGQTEFARRSLDYFITRYNNHGFLTTGYTMMGTGWHLWTLARHYALDQDTEWFRTVAPKVAQACQWIALQCEKTQRDGAILDETPEYGLVPPGVGADWNRFAYRFGVQAHYYAGLHDAAQALVAIQYPAANQLLESAEGFRANLLRAYRWNQARSPVLALSNGTWIPAYGGMLYCFGPIGDMIPGEDGNRSWAYDVELGAHHLIPLGLLDPLGRDTAEIMDHMEDASFLHAGMGEYPADKNHADWFNQGGFSKVQPYYTRNAEICAARDDVKPFIRSYFNAIASLLSLENLSFWEHFHNQGAWNKTHETGWFLVQTRTMLVQERGNALWLAPFIPNTWLEDGKTVSVSKAPTAFGPVNYRISSSVGQGFIEAAIDLPARAVPKALVLRLRHPQGLPMQSVKVDGATGHSFDAAKECISIEGPTGALTVRASY